MRSRFTSLVVAAFVSFLSASPHTARGQSIMTGALSGSVIDELGRGVSGALVTVTTLGGGSGREVRTANAGRFALAAMSPGSFEVRVEAVGYRPLLARTLTIGPGEQRVLSFTLTRAQPPVITVDSITLSGGSSTIARRGGMQLGPREIDRLPRRFEDLSSLVALSSAFDASMGAEGLPGDLTLIVADGVPYYRAPHPTARAEAFPGALFPTAALSGVSALHNAPDIEWAGAAGGYVTLATRSAASDPELALDAAYSAGPGWSSSELDISRPALNSFQGSGHGATAVGSGGSELLLSVDALRHQTPLTPRTSSALAGTLVDVDPDLVSALSTPAVETYSRYSGLARLDVLGTESSRIYVRGAASYVKRDFDGAGPVSPGIGAAPAEESIDFSIAGGMVREYSPTVTLELRGGVSGSFRDFGGASADAPPAYLTESRVSLGALPSSLGESSRTDLLLIPVLHYAHGLGRVKVGGTVRASNHTMDHTGASTGDYVFADVASVAATRGFVHRSTAPEASFSTQEFGLFAQYSGTPASGLQLVLGARYDYERIPSGEASQNMEWLAATGLDNTDSPRGFNQLSARGSITWEPSPTAGTRVTAVASVHSGDLDPRAVHELLSRDTGATITRYVGSGVDWPAGGLPAAVTDLPALTLLGPDTRPPRSVRFSAGLTQPFAGGLSLHVGGALRRTDFLMRRRNLNLPVVAQALDPDGRPVFGTLEQDGGLVTTTSDDARRFPSFGEVWALDPDGWSEYRAVSVGFEHIASSVDLFGMYTYSETTDNWIGAASGLVDASLPPGLAVVGETEWAEGTSDFDVPHRVSAGGLLRAGRVTLSAVYRFRSGLPFTPGYRYGVDVNGDGSMRNDVAFVPDQAALALLLDSWPCLEDQAVGFAVRNSCRGPDRHAIDARIELSLGSIGGRRATLALDGLNLLESSGGVRDDALLLVDPGGSVTTSPDGSVVMLQTVLNPDFGTVVYPTSRGRMLRLGVRIGG